MPVTIPNHKSSAVVAWMPLSLALIVVASFWPAIGADFVAWDDDLNLTDNVRYRGLSLEHLRWMATTTHGGHYQPLTWISWAMDYLVWGMDPRGYHLTNLVLHAAAVLVFYALASRLLLGTQPAAQGGATRMPPDSSVIWAAAVGTLFFAVHPLRAESVVWVSERRDVLSGFFYLLALWAYVRMVAAGSEGTAALREGQRVRRRWLAASLGCFVLSLLSKAWGMTFPAVLLILDVYPLRRPAREGWARVLTEKALFLLPALVAAGAAFAAQHSVEDMRTFAEHPLGARIAQATYGLCFYPWKTLLPTDLSPLYLLRPGFDVGAPRFVVSGALVVVVTAGLVAMRHRWPWALAAWAAYAVIVSPVLGLAQTGPQLVADRYSYLSCLPWALLAAAAVFGVSCSSRRARIAVRGGAVLAVAVLASLTFRQASIWTDSETLWSHAIRLDPTNHIAFTNRGFAGADPERALADYGEALRLDPRFYLAYFNRGELRQQLGDNVGAVTDYTAAIDVLPADPKAYNNRGWAKQALGDAEGAAADYRKALDLAPPGWGNRALVEGNLARVLSPPPQKVAP